MHPVGFGIFSGFSLIIALGPQNVFLIRQGIMRNHVFVTALVCLLCDAILIVASTSGVSQVALTSPSIKNSMVILGSLFLLYYGANSFKSAIESYHEPSENVDANHEMKSLIASCMAATSFSLLNPQAIVDTMVIIGGLSLHVAQSERLLFTTGVITASFLWFYTIAIGSYLSTNLLNKKNIWIGLDVISGTLMLYFSIKLLAEVSIYS